jgi:hypothetical protein
MFFNPVYSLWEQVFFKPEKKEDRRDKMWREIPIEEISRPISHVKLYFKKRQEKKIKKI